MCIEVFAIAKGDGLQDDELMESRAPLGKSKSVEIRGADTHELIIFQNLKGGLVEGIDYKCIVKVWSSGGDRGFRVEVIAQAFIELTETLVVLRNSDELLFGAFSKIYTYYWFYPLFRTQADEVQAGRSAVDICKR